MSIFVRQTPMHATNDSFNCSPAAQLQLQAADQGALQGLRVPPLWHGGDILMGVQQQLGAGEVPAAPEEENPNVPPQGAEDDVVGNGQARARVPAIPFLLPPSPVKGPAVLPPTPPLPPIPVVLGRS